MLQRQAKCVILYPPLSSTLENSVSTTSNFLKGSGGGCAQKSEQRHGYQGLPADGVDRSIIVCYGLCMWIRAI